MKLQEVAALIQGDVEGDGNADICRVAKIEEAGPGDITFLANPKYARFLPSTKATAVIVGKSLTRGEHESGDVWPSLVRVDDPYLGFLKILVTFNPPQPPLPPGIHSTAVIAATAILGEDVRIGAHAVIGERTRIGARAMIGHCTVLADDVSVEQEALLYPHVTVREGCRIGARTIVHSGAVIGSDGFGFAPKADGTYEKIPQMGIVVIEEDVEIGANCTVDRATLGETRIKKGVKLDNLIQVAHNVVIGENTVMAAQAGISGSTKLGRNVMVGGQVGFTGHLEIADGTKIGAQSGVHRSIQTPGGTFMGSPVMPQRDAFRVMGSLSHLPDLLNTVRDLQKKVDELQQIINERKGPPSGHPEPKD